MFSIVVIIPWLIQLIQKVFIWAHKFRSVVSKMAEQLHSVKNCRGLNSKWQTQDIKHTGNGISLLTPWNFLALDDTPPNPSQTNPPMRFKHVNQVYFFVTGLSGISGHKRLVVGSLKLRKTIHKVICSKSLFFPYMFLSSISRNLELGMVAHSFKQSTQIQKEVGSVNSRPAWSTQQVQGQRGIHKVMYLKKETK